LNIIKELYILGKTGFIEKEKKSISQSLIFILKVIGVLIVLKIFSIGVLRILDEVNIFETPRKIGFRQFKLNTLLQYIYIAIYAPIVEELAFRVGLRVSKRNLILMIFALSLIISRGFLNIEWLISISISLLLSIVLFLSFKMGRTFDLINNFHVKNRGLVFYILLLSFGFMHLIGYEITLELLLFSPIVVFSHITAGFMFSYVRLKLGVVFSMILHCLNNSLPFVLMYFIR